MRLCGEGSFEGVCTTMTLHFHSDSSVTQNGFTFEYSQIPGTYVYRQYFPPDQAETSWYIAKNIVLSLIDADVSFKSGWFAMLRGLMVYVII